MSHFILISVGSNIDKEQHTSSGLDALERSFGELGLSPIYESESVGFAGDTFYNLVVSAFTELSIADVCAELKRIEDDNGRVRGAKKFASRTLDLDLLTYDGVITDEPVILPREEILYNAFVLQPLADLVPEHIHPIAKQSYAALWANYDKQKQNLWVADYKWSSSQL